MSGSIPPEDPSTELVVVEPPKEPTVNDSVPPAQNVTVAPVPGGYVATTFDSVAGMNAQINEALSAVPEGKRGAFLVRADLKKASAALMIRAGENVSFLARIQKTYVEGWGGDLSARVTFLKAGEVSTAPMSFLDYYLIFRTAGVAFVPNSRFRALVKAVGIYYLNRRPYLDGAAWWDSSAPTAKDSTNG